MMVYRLGKLLCQCALLAFIRMDAFSARTVSVFEPITDVAELTDGSSFYIVSVEAVPYAITTDDAVTNQHLISSYTNSGLGVRCQAENRIQKLTLSGSDLSNCYLKQGEKRYLGCGYDGSAGTYATTDLTDEYCFSISIESDGSAAIVPYLNDKVRLGMCCGDDQSYTLYQFKFLDATDPGYVPVMLVSDIIEQLSDAPIITSTDGMLASEPDIPEGYTLEYRVREVADAAQLRATADDAGWKPWSRQSYISDLFGVTTEQYDLDMRYYSEGLYSAVTTERFQKPILTGINTATASAAAAPTYYDLSGRPIPRRALRPGHPYIRIAQSRPALIIAR